MSKLEVFRELISQRLTAVALEIFAAVEKSFSEYEEEISRSKEESVRLQRLLDAVILPEIKIRRPDVQQFSLPEPPQIKEEEELRTSQEEEQLQGLQLGTIEVKQDWDQEEFSECSHVDQTVKVDNSEGDSLPSNTEEQLKAESDGQDCSAPEADSDSQPLSAGAPDCPTAQSLEEEEQGAELLFEITTLNNEAPPRENVPQRRYKQKKMHRCQQCNQWFARKYQLIMHRRTHSGEKTYECQRCRQWFSRKVNLAQHMKTHPREKFYQCQECSIRFSKKSDLVDHMMRSHPGEKPYICLECCKTFALHDSLEKHMRGHKKNKMWLFI